MEKNNADIQRFLDKVYEETSNSGETCDLITFNEFWDRQYGAAETNFDRRSFLNDISVLAASNQISYYQELTSYKRGIAPVVFFFKKIIRKICAFLFLPVVAAQNSVNMSFSRVALHIRNYVNREELLKMQFQKKEMELSGRIEIQQKEIIALNERIDELSGKRENLISGGDNK